MKKEKSKKKYFEFRCPNCGSKFEETEDPFILKPGCKHFPNNVKLVKE
jgi:DNA-directed RNA polymerase subunit RPC12/RpoP